MRTFILLLTVIGLNLGLKAQTKLNSSGAYVWKSVDEPKTFNQKLQLTFVRAQDGFPSYGTVVAGGGYSSSQDGSAFQLYFPYNKTYGGIAPKIRLGIYNNQGWSEWHTFYTSANANNPDTDWSAKTIIAKDKIAIGTSSVPSGYRLAVNGNIRAKEIKVETGWSDFVFEDDYKLPTLKEVEKHIKEKGHLKDIPSADEVDKNGISLGEMDSKLLQKIEELTLYTITQQKKIEKLEKENEALKTINFEVIKLQERLDKLEKN